MAGKYRLDRLMGCWAVTMSANNHIVERFADEQAALRALEDFEEGRRFMKQKTDVWVVGGVFVSEAGVGGMSLGECSELDMGQYNVVARLTEAEYDALVEEFRAQHDGDYPDS